MRSSTAGKTTNNSLLPRGEGAAKRRMRGALTRRCAPPSPRGRGRSPANSRHLHFLQAGSLRRANLRIAIVALAPDSADHIADFFVSLAAAQQLSEIVAFRREQAEIQLSVRC